MVICINRDEVRSYRVWSANQTTRHSTTTRPSLFPSMASLRCTYTHLAGLSAGAYITKQNPSPSRRIPSQLSDVIGRNITSPCPLKSPCFHPRRLRAATAARLCFSSSATNPPELSMTILPTLSIWRRLRWLLGEPCFVRCQLR